MKRHIGILNNTGARVAVIFRELPDDPSSCLIAEMDRLPDRYHDPLQEILNSKEAAQTHDFYTVLHRRRLPDGNNALQGFHTNGLLRKVKVEEVDMIVGPHQHVPLKMINDQINGTAVEAQEVAKIAPVTEKTPVTDEEKESIAKGLMVQAELLKQEAEAKLAEAQSYAPHLFSKKRGRPVKTEAEKAKAVADEKVKRKDRNQTRAEVQANAAVDAQVQAKIERDSKPDVNKPVKLT